MKITKPATIHALAKGDFKNAIIAETPGGIEAQEKAGQQEFVTSTSLPIEFEYCERKDLEDMGIKFGDKIDDLFIEAILPDGWEKIATDHDMWSKVVDETGKERLRIFYKAAFYDRRASLSIIKD